MSKCEFLPTRRTQATEDNSSTAKNVLRYIYIYNNLTLLWWWWEKRPKIWRSRRRRSNDTKKAAEMSNLDFYSIKIGWKRQEGIPFWHFARWVSGLNTTQQAQVQLVLTTQSILSCYIGHLELLFEIRLLPREKSQRENYRRNSIKYGSCYTSCATNPPNFNIGWYIPNLPLWINEMND